MCKILLPSVSTIYEKREIQFYPCFSKDKIAVNSALRDQNLYQAPQKLQQIFAKFYYVVQYRGEKSGADIHTDPIPASLLYVNQNTKIQLRYSP